MCRFCNEEGASDSIEHIVNCTVVQSMLPPRLRRGSPPKVPPQVFFLIGLDESNLIAMGVFMFGLYTMHNEVRHGAGTTQFKQRICRIMGEI